MLHKGTYIDIGRLFPRQPSNMYYGMHDFLPSPSLPNGNLLGSMEGRSEAWSDEALCWARVDDGQTFERDYKNFQILAPQRVNFS